MSAPSSLSALQPPHAWEGLCSEFGGARDVGMAHDTGLTLYEWHEADRATSLFHPGPRELETWKRLKVGAFYVALPFMGSAGAQPFRRQLQCADIRVTCLRTGRSALARCVDRGPAPGTGRVVDCSPGLLAAIGATTDDRVRVEVLSHVDGLVLDPRTVERAVA